VLALGAVSLLNDAATEMMVPLLPVFLTSTLGASAMALGWIEGAAEATASVLKLLSGRASDRMKRRRPLILVGYGLASLVRPFMAVTTSAMQALTVRVTDRIGKGLRTSPRDALLAASVREDQRGAAFGLHRAMDHTGAVIGPAIAAAVLAFWTTDLRTLFWLTAIPGALAMTALFVGVREQAPTVEDVGAATETEEASRGQLARLLIPLGLFTLGNASDAFLLLKAGATRAPLVTLPLLWMALHVVKAAASLPAGRLADRHGRRRIIAAGWILYAAVYLGFAYAESQAVIWGLFVAYGLHSGLTEGAEKALVAELVPGAKLGAGFGWYHLTLGGLSLAASVIFGALWTGLGNRVAFLTSAGLAVGAVIALAALAPGRSSDATPR
jgi:MFS family permease